MTDQLPPGYHLKTLLMVLVVMVALVVSAIIVGFGLARTLEPRRRLTMTTGCDAAYVSVYRSL